jgi:GPH family glycoside/pentoside/hexuronide:cation symporter
MPWTANLVLVSVAGRTPEGRATLASIRATWSALGAIVFSYGAPALIAGTIAWAGPQFGYAGIALVTAVLFTLGYFINFLLTQGYEEIEAPSAGKTQSKSKASGGDMAKALFQNSHLIFLLIADFPRFLFSSLLMASVVYYFNYVAHRPGLIVVYMLVTAIGRTIGSYLSRLVMAKLTARIGTIIMYGIVGACCFIAFFNYMNPWWVIGFLILANLANGAMVATFTALYADAAIFSQWKLGADSRGWIMGLSTFPIKMAFVVRSFIINLVLGLVGFNAAIPASEATAELQRGISAAMLPVPGALMIIGMLILIFGYRITHKRVIQYQEEINARQTPQT